MIKRFYFESKLVRLISKFAISFTNIRKFIQIFLKKKIAPLQRLISPRRGNEPRSPAWPAGILTTIVPRNKVLQICLLKVQIIGSEIFTIIKYIDQTTPMMIKGFYFEVKLVKLISMFDIF